MKKCEHESICHTHGCQCLGLPWEVPENAGNRGILLRRTGKNESLFRFWARFGKAINDTELRQLLKMLILATKSDVKTWKERKAGVKSQL